MKQTCKSYVEWRLQEVSFEISNIWEELYGFKIEVSQLEQKLRRELDRFELDNTCWTNKRNVTSVSQNSM